MNSIVFILPKVAITLQTKGVKDGSSAKQFQFQEEECWVGIVKFECKTVGWSNSNHEKMQKMKHKSGNL